MKINWDRIATIFERASGLPLDHPKEIKTYKDFETALDRFGGGTEWQQEALDILRFVSEEVERKSMLRRDETYTGWLNELLEDPDSVSTVIDICDFVARFDIKTAGAFYYDEVMWGALGRAHSESGLRQTARIVEYADMAMAQGVPDVAVRMLDMYYHYDMDQEFSPQVNAEIRDRYAKALIAYIDHDLRAAKLHMDNEAGVGGPNPEYEQPYYLARAYLAAQELKNKGQPISEELLMSPFVKIEKDETLYPVIRFNEDKHTRFLNGPQ